MRLNPESSGWPSFRLSQHAIGFVNFNGEFPWLPDEIIAELKQRCDVINQEGGIWRRYQPGDWVQVFSSTIQGLAQVVEDGKTLGVQSQLTPDLEGRLPVTKPPV